MIRTRRPRAAPRSSDVNTRLQDLFLRRAVDRTRHETATVRQALAALRLARENVVGLVRGATLFDGERTQIARAGLPPRPGLAPPRAAAERLADLNALLARVAVEVGRFTQAAAALSRRDLRDLAAVELHQVPREVHALLTKAAEAPLRESTLAEQEPPQPTPTELALGVSFHSVPEAQLADMLASPLGGAFYETSFADLGTGMVTGIRRALLGGLTRGLGVAPVARLVQGVIRNARWQTERIVRSEYVRTANQAAVETFRQNADVLRGVQWTATLDFRSCLQCGRLDGRTYPDAEAAPMPVRDTHPNCFAPDVRVEASVLLGTRMLYLGPMIEVKTRGGRCVHLTPNHPVLRTTGMCPAHLLREGDDLVCRAFSVRDEHDQHMPLTIEQVFQSIGAQGAYVPAAPLCCDNFHGDAHGGNGDVDIVALDCQLLDDAVAALSQSCRDRVLELSTMTQRHHARPGAIYEFRERAFHSQHCGVRGLGLALAPFDRRPAPFQALGGRTATQLHARLAKAGQQHAPTDARFVAELFQRRSIAVDADQLRQVDDRLRADADASFAQARVEYLASHAGAAAQGMERNTALPVADQIVQIRHYDFSGYVYDLQTESGFIIAEGIVTSNCRCVLVPLVRGADDLGLPPASRASFSGQVPETLRYDEWFGQQGAAFQRDVLGPTRFRLYDQGRLALRDFATARGVRPVSDVLASLREAADDDDPLADALEEAERILAEVTDRLGHEHAPGGSPEGGQFVGKGGEGGGGVSAPSTTGAVDAAYMRGDKTFDGFVVPVTINKAPGDFLVMESLKAAKLPTNHFDGLARIAFHESGWVSTVSAATGKLSEASGTYDPASFEIKLAVNAPSGGNVFVFGGKVVLHEIGHHVHLAKLTDAGAKEWATYSENGQRARISAYARTNRGEHFAEAYRAYAAGGTHRAALKRIEPQAYRFMRTLSKKLLPSNQYAAGDWMARYKA